jgi:hypothetical protein
LGELGIKYTRVLVIFSLRSSLISSIDCCDEQSCEYSSLSLSSNPRDSFDEKEIAFGTERRRNKKSSSWVN